MPARVPFLTSVSDLPGNIELSIFGAGMLGVSLAGTLQRDRKDITIRSFVDSNKTGTLNNIPVLNPDIFFKRTEKDHLVVVATHFWLREVLALLQDHGFVNIIISAIIPEETGEYSQVLDKHLQDIRIIEKELTGTRSKMVWQAVIQGMRGDLSSLLQMFLTRQGRQYLDHVILNKKNTVIEGGMFDGTNTRQFAEIVGPEGKVIAFDPLPARIPDLPPQVVVENMALWKETTTLYLLDKGAGSTVSRTQADNAKPIRAVDLDSYLRGQHADYIKLDVEGAELEVLQGAAETIRRHRPQLAVSIYHSPQDYFQVPLKIFSICTGYLFFLESYSPSMGDKILIAIPEEKYFRREIPRVW